MSATQLPGAGDLNRRIQLRLRTDVPNAEFGVDETYSAGIARWAKKEPVHSISVRAGQNVGEAPTDLFWIRWGTGTKPTDMTEGFVIELDGRRYRVMDAIDVDDLHRFTRITAKDLGVIL